MSDQSGNNPPPRTPTSPATGAGGPPPAASSPGYPVGAATSGSPTPSQPSGGGASPAREPAPGSPGASAASGTGPMHANPPIATPMSDLGIPPDMDAMSALLAQNWWALVLRGILGILFGLAALFAPGAVILSFVIFFAAYLLVDGVFAIVAAVRAAQAHQRWGLLLAEGLLNIAMGAVAFLFPFASVVAFVLVTAAWALLTGGLMLASAFRLHADHGRWWLALGGVVSLIWGVLLAISPVVGAVVLTWWLGGYAIAFGLMLLVLGFRLRAKHQGGDAGGPRTSAAGRV